MRPKGRPGATRTGNEHRAAAGDLPEHGAKRRRLPPDLPPVAGPEATDDYAHVLAVSGRWRVIRCRNDWYYVVQVRSPNVRKYPWRAVRYCTKEYQILRELRRFSKLIKKDDFERLLEGLLASGLFRHPAKRRRGGR